MVRSLTCRACASSCPDSRRRSRYAGSGRPPPGRRYWAAAAAARASQRAAAATAAGRKRRIDIVLFMRPPLRSVNGLLAELPQAHGEQRDVEEEQGPENRGDRQVRELRHERASQPL